MSRSILLLFFLLLTLVSFSVCAEKEVIFEDDVIQLYEMTKAGSLKQLKNIPEECQDEAIRKGEKKACILEKSITVGTEIGIPTSDKVVDKKVDILFSEGKLIPSEVYLSAERESSLQDGWLSFFFLLAIPFSGVVLVLVNTESNKKVFLFSTAFILTMTAASLENTYFSPSFVVGVCLVMAVGFYATHRKKEDYWIYGVTGSFLSSASPLKLLSSTDMSWQAKDMSEYLVWFISFCIIGFVARLLNLYCQKKKEEAMTMNHKAHTKK